jgi:hypothetical protein
MVGQEAEPARKKTQCDNQEYRGYALEDTQHDRGEYTPRPFAGARVCSESGGLDKSRSGYKFPSEVKNRKGVT